MPFLVQDFNERKHLPSLPELLHVMSNAALYIEAIQLDSHTASSSILSQSPWGSFLSLFDSFLKSLCLLLSTSFSPTAGSPSPIPVASCDLTPVLRIIVQSLKLPVLSNYRTALESYSKFLSLAIQLSPIPYEMLLELCSLCLRAFAKERDRLMLSRTVVFELQQAIKFKTVLNDKTLLSIVQFILQDCGGSLVPCLLNKHLKMNTCSEIASFSTGGSECMKQHLNECIDFVADIHALRRMKVTIRILNALHGLQTPSFSDDCFPLLSDHDDDDDEEFHVFCVCLHFLLMFDSGNRIRFPLLSFFFFLVSRLEIHSHACSTIRTSSAQRLSADN